MVAKATLEILLSDTSPPARTGVPPGLAPAGGSPGGGPPIPGTTTPRPAGASPYFLPGGGPATTKPKPAGASPYFLPGGGPGTTKPKPAGASPYLMPGGGPGTTKPKPIVPPGLPSKFEALQLNLLKASDALAMAGFGKTAKLLQTLGMATTPAIMGIVGIGAAATGLVLAVRAAYKSIASEVANLKEVSGVVAMAAAETEIKRIRANVDRGKRIGGDVARFERARVEIELAMFELVTEIKEILVKLVVPIMEAIAFLIRNVPDGVTMIDAIMAIVGPSLHMVTGGLTTSVYLLDKIHEWFAGDDEEDAGLGKMGPNLLNLLRGRGDFAPERPLPPHAVAPI
tara:strand:- start:9805 stop:10830 length:1026 start_codon:yes stop_codon:yes gene_type:complete